MSPIPPPRRVSFIDIAQPLFFVLLGTLLGPSPARAQARDWENRSQSEISGAALDIDRSGSTVVSSGLVGDGIGVRWFVRGMDRTTGATIWEDRYGPLIHGTAKDIAVDGRRVFAAGWIFTPGLGYEFVVRAYDVRNGELLWHQQIGRGAQCVEERPNFARCVAKALAVSGGRVFVVGHLTRTANRSDFAVLAFDAVTGARIWESVTDPTGTGSNDFAWGVVAQAERVYVVGEIGNFSGLLLQAHDPATGTIQWQQQTPGASNGTLKDSIAASRQEVFIAGNDVDGHFMIRAFDGSTGAGLWDDHVGDATEVGYAAALAVGGSDADSDEQLFAVGVVGCNPSTFLECELAVRAYHPRLGILWHRADPAVGGDWYATNIAAGGGQVVVGGDELLGDGVYHPMLRSYKAATGSHSWTTFIDDGEGTPVFDFTGFVNGILVDGDRVLVSGTLNGPEERQDFVVQQYRRP